MSYPNPPGGPDDQGWQHNGGTPPPGGPGGGYPPPPSPSGGYPPPGGPSGGYPAPGDPSGGYPAPPNPSGGYPPPHSGGYGPPPAPGGYPPGPGGPPAPYGGPGMPPPHQGPGWNNPYGQGPYDQGPTPYERNSAKTLQIVCILGWLFSLIMYLVKKDESPFVRMHAAKALNFQLVMMIFYFIAAMLSFLVIGALIFLGLLIFSIVTQVKASGAAERGEEPHFPFSLGVAS